MSPGEPYISVIIPVYNAGKYIADCLQSIQAAGFSSYEIICVDDGSSDSSADVIKEFIGRDGRIRLIQQDNGGVSAARNAGMAAAAGRYLAFVDADDTVTTDFFDHIKDLDTSVITCFSDQFFNKALLSGANMDKFNKSDILYTVIPSYLQNELGNSVVAKFYETPVIRSHGVRFPEGMPLGEDGYFNVAYLQCVEELVVFRGTIYCYRETEGSATRNLKKHNYLEAFVKDKDRYRHLTGHLYDKDKLERWSSIKMIRNILSVLSVYFRNQPGISSAVRMKMVRDMLYDKDVRKALDAYYNEMMEDTAGRFERFILKAMKQRSLFRLKLAFKYVHWRNGIK